MITRALMQNHSAAEPAEEGGTEHLLHMLKVPGLISGMSSEKDQVVGDVRSPDLRPRRATVKDQGSIMRVHV